MDSTRKAVAEADGPAGPDLDGVAGEVARPDAEPAGATANPQAARPAAASAVTAAIAAADALTVGHGHGPLHHFYSHAHFENRRKTP